MTWSKFIPRAFIHAVRRLFGTVWLGTQTYIDFGSIWEVNQTGAHLCKLLRNLTAAWVPVYIYTHIYLDTGIWEHCETHMHVQDGGPALAGG